MQKIQLFFFLILLPTIAAAQTAPPRRIAVTIDDLPVAAFRQDLETRRKLTRDLLSHIREAKIPVVGFVNESKLYDAGGKRVEAEIDLLRSWLDAGLELGNHTFSHISLNKYPLEKYEADILRGEIITKELMQAKNMKIRYFRHPYLMTGKSTSVETQKRGEVI